MKTVIIYHREQGAYEVVRHDLDDSVAIKQVKRLRSAGEEAYAIDQDGPHYGDTDHCDLCTRLAVKFLSTLSEGKAEILDKQEESPLAIGLGTVPSVDEAPSGGLVSIPTTSPWRKALPYVAGLSLLAIVLILLIGPLAPWAQKTLSLLAPAVQPTPGPETTEAAFIPASPTELAPTATSTNYVVILATNTPSPSNTPVPPTATSTLLPTQAVTPTAQPLESAPATPEAVNDGCLPAQSVSLDDAGKSLCVTGTVVRSYEKDGTVYIVFSDTRGTFYMVSYEVNWGSSLPAGCIRARGEIQRLGNSPIMVINLRQQISACP